MQIQSHNPSEVRNTISLFMHTFDIEIHKIKSSLSENGNACTQRNFPMNYDKPQTNSKITVDCNGLSYKVLQCIWFHVMRYRNGYNIPRILLNAVRYIWLLHTRPNIISNSH